jgi:hypothetical protein
MHHSGFENRRLGFGGMLRCGRDRHWLNRL